MINEHYEKAEELLDSAAKATAGPMTAHALQAAQVHATLALVDAVASGSWTITNGFAELISKISKRG